MKRTVVILVPVLSALAAAGSIWGWLRLTPVSGVEMRVPVDHHRGGAKSAPVDLTGTLTKGPGVPSDDPGSWPCFRGAKRTNIAPPQEKLLRSWPAKGPQELWRIPLGEGYAGAAVNRGRVYLVDYDRDKQQDVVRCMSLADGRDLWRYAYPDRVKRNHGMSRTVPAVTDDYVLTLGPKCHVHCLKADTGEMVWRMDLVHDYGATVPPWYAGQCPLIDDGKAILVPGGDALMMAVELSTGKILWKTPNPGGWTMTHTSVLPMDYHGVREYVYLGTMGVIGIRAEDGAVLWRRDHPVGKEGDAWKDLWKVNQAPIATPVQAGDDRIFLTSGYNAGCMMLKLSGDTPDIKYGSLWRLKPEEFGSDQQTPIWYDGYLYGTIPPIKDGRLACLSPDGKVTWRSPMDRKFGLGPYLIADGLILALEDETGTLRLAEASPRGYHELASAKVLSGHDAWAPMALVNGKLLLRDSTEMVCLRVGRRE